MFKTAKERAIEAKIACIETELSKDIDEDYRDSLEEDLAEAKWWLKVANTEASYEDWERSF